ncbi:MAG: glycosyltransferase family 39 protein [Candidatus Omnitrophota bacterium]
MRTAIWHDKKVIFALAAIVLVGAALRIHGLTNQSLWHDEAGNWVRSGFGNLLTVLDQGERDVHPPAYLVLLYFCRKIMGDSETALRLPSVIFGILTIPLVFLLGSRVYSHREGLIAASILAVSWMPLFYSQDATSYAMLLFLTCLTAYLWIVLVQGLARGSVPLWAGAGYVLSAAACAYTHYFGLFLVCLQAIGLLFLTRRDRRAWVSALIVYSLVFILYLPWLDPVVSDLMRTKFRHLRPALSDVMYVFFCFFNHSSLLMYLFFLMGITAFLKFIWRKESTTKTFDTLPQISPDALLLLWFLLPVAIIYIKSLVSVPMLKPRYLIISLPAAYLLFARPITVLFGHWKARAAACLLLTGWILCDLLWGLDYYSKPQKEQVREVVQAIVGRTDFSPEGLLVVCAHGGWGHEAFNYYLEKNGSTRRIDLPVGGEKNYTFRVSKIIEERDPKYLWFLAGHRKPEREFMEYLYRHYKLEEHRAFHKAGYWLFKK